MPYKDPYDEYLRNCRRQIEKRKERRIYNQKYYKENKEKIRKQQTITQRKWQNEHREYYNKRSRTENYVYYHKDELPLAKECELCPDDDKRTDKLQRHHPDYDYPTIYVTVCPQCQKEIHLAFESNNYKEFKIKKEGDC